MLRTIKMNRSIISQSKAYVKSINCEKGMSRLYYGQQHFNGNAPANNTIESNQRLQQVLLDAIVGEATGIDFYSRLANLAPNPKHKEDILKIMEDEKAHLNLFLNLFIALTGRQPIYQINNVPFQSYDEGLQIAFEDELKDYETYRNQYLMTLNTSIRDIFLRAFTDEIKHATRISYLKDASFMKDNFYVIKDYGPEPFVINITDVTKQNDTFRTALWTRSNLQLTLMSIDVGEDIGIEMHPHVDQFLRVEEGQGVVRMGKSKDELTFEEKVYDDFAIIIPAGTWHNVINTGQIPLKLYSIYAPPQHPYGTVHHTKEEAEAAEEHQE